MSQSFEAFKLSILFFTAVFPVLNPVGSALILFGMTGSISRSQRADFAKRVSIYSFILLAAFFLCGRFVLEFFGVSIPVVQISGGMVLVLMGWQLLNQKETPKADPQQVAEGGSLESKCFYPFTFPLSIGPGCLAIAITLGTHIRRDSLLTVTIDDFWGLLGFAAACLVYYFCLYYMQTITQKMRPSFLIATSKIIAFFVLCIGAQIAWSGIQALAIK